MIPILKDVYLIQEKVSSKENLDALELEPPMVAKVDSEVHHLMIKLILKNVRVFFQILIGEEENQDMMVQEDQVGM